MPQTNTDIAPVHLHVNKMPEKYYEFQYLFASQVTSLISGRCWSEDQAFFGHGFGCYSWTM